MDTNKMRDISREQFEATWADVMRGDEPPPGRKPTRSRIDPEKYAGDAAQFAWKWWQRSREAVVVELPEPESPESYGVTQKDDPEQYQVLESRMGAQYSAIFKCKRAIEAQGLKVSP